MKFLFNCKLHTSLLSQSPKEAPTPPLILSHIPIQLCSSLYMMQFHIFPHNTNPFTIHSNSLPSAKFLYPQSLLYICPNSILDGTCSSCSCEYSMPIPDALSFSIKFLLPLKLRHWSSTAPCVNHL